MSALLLKHLDTLLTGLVPIVLLWLRIRAQLPHAHAAVEEAESSTPTGTDKRIDNAIKHDRASRAMDAAPIHVRPLFRAERDALIRSSVKRRKLKAKGSSDE